MLNKPTYLPMIMGFVRDVQRHAQRHVVTAVDVLEALVHLDEPDTHPFLSMIMGIVLDAQLHVVRTVNPLEMLVLLDEPDTRPFLLENVTPESKNPLRLPAFQR